VEPSEAYKRFKDEIVSAENIDFSDKLSRSIKTGYKSKYGFIILGLSFFVNTNILCFKYLMK